MSEKKIYSQSDYDEMDKKYRDSIDSLLSVNTELRERLHSCRQNASKEAKEIALDAAIKVFPQCTDVLTLIGKAEVIYTFLTSNTQSDT